MRTSTVTEYSEGFVKVSGAQIYGLDLIVCDHEVTRGEYRSIFDNNPYGGNGATAYDESGNIVTSPNDTTNPAMGLNWYNTLVYCNKLSIKENLTPCYTIKGSTNPENWGDIPTAQNADWDNVICDFNASGYRLPTQNEWEYLAKGGENYKYPGSDNIDEVAWYSENSNNGTHVVKTKKANGFKLYDMSGNADEWCWDKYLYSPGINHYISRGGASLDETTKVFGRENNDRKGYGFPGNGGFRVVRTFSNN